jgi:serine/threonine-protein kinase HipA
MGLHLVGETIDKTRSHYLAETGKLVQLMRGIYVDASDDIDRTVLTHAVRIARYLYPKAYLSGASAVLLGPTAEGRLYITGQRAQRTRLRALEITQNKAPSQPFGCHGRGRRQPGRNFGEGLGAAPTLAGGLSTAQ